MSIRALTTLPNVGPAIARRLMRLGIEEPSALRGQDPDEMFDRLGELGGHAEDPCVLDTFRAIVAHADGEPSRPWWQFSRERLARGDRG
jgi:nucleotidyltransferase/DNA polymerase involved in DNA repair